MEPKRKPSAAIDATDPVEASFEDHWDKLKAKLNEWVKSSLRASCNPTTGGLEKTVTPLISKYFTKFR